MRIEPSKVRVNKTSLIFDDINDTMHNVGWKTIVFYILYKDKYNIFKRTFMNRNESMNKDGIDLLKRVITFKNYYK